MNYILWADGSCFDNGKPTAKGGWAYILLDENEETICEASGIETPSTNNRMELKAVLEGLRAIPETSKVLVRTDSLYVINGFAKGWIEGWRADNYQTKLGKERKNRDLWEELYPEVHSREVDWLWVSGHSGVFHNEYVDLRAKEVRGGAPKPRKKREFYGN